MRSLCAGASPAAVRASRVSSPQADRGTVALSGQYRGRAGQAAPTESPVTHPPPLNDLSALSPLAPALASTIASLAGDIALVLDRDGVIRSIAEGAAPLSPECARWVGRPWVDTVTADTRRKIEMLLDEVREGGVARRREVNHPASEGDSIPVAWSALRLGPSGAVIAVGRDLRAVAAIQQRFLDTQQELERAYWRRRQDDTRDDQLRQAALDALFVLDASTLQVLEANGPALVLLRQDRSTAVGRVWTELLAPAARAAASGLLVGARSSGRAGEIRLRLADHDVPVGLAATPFRGRHGQCLLVRARREALAGEAAARDTSDTEAVLVVDSAARVQMANAVALRRLGARAEGQLQGRPLADLLPADEAPAWTALVDQARSRGLVSNVPAHLGAGGGPVEVTAALMPEGEQECVSLVWSQQGAARRAAPPPTVDDGLRQITSQLGRVPLPDLLAQANDAAERHLIAVAHWRAGGSQEAAAQLLDLSLEQLAQRMQRLGLPPPGAVE